MSTALFSLLDSDDIRKDAGTMKPKARESIKDNLRQIQEMTPEDKEQYISKFRKRWEKYKKAYNPEEQEKLRNEFNAACPGLKL